MQNLEKYKTKDLKQILKNLNLPISGKKDELIKRIKTSNTQILPTIREKKYSKIDFIPTNHIKFQDFIDEQFKLFKLDSLKVDSDPCLKKEKNELFKYFKYQKFLIEYMSLHNQISENISKSRGLLVYHGLGSGKTCTAIGMAEASRLYNYNSTPKFRKVLLLIPASLKQEPWIKELTGKCGPEKIKNSGLFKINQYGYYFIHYNGQPLKQLKIFKSSNPFDNSVIIIDEIHNFVNTLPKEIKSARHEIYNMIMNAKNSKLIFLSGTPIMNEPFELSFMFNMLRGFKIFPEDKEKFDKLYLRDKRFINQRLFQRKINGLVSYYKGARDDVFAKKSVKRVFVQMSDYQSRLHDVINKFEENLRSGTVTDVDAHNKANEYTQRQILERQIITLKRAQALKVRGWLKQELGIKSFGVTEKKQIELFRVFTISNSNFAYPMSVIKMFSRKNVPNIIKISDEQLKKLPKFDLKKSSPKMLKIYENLMKSKGPDLIYSRFKSAYGLGVFGKVLQQFGFERFVPKKFKGRVENMEKKLRYVFWTGDTSDEDKIKILEVYNHPENINGQLIKAICLTQAGKEGISLMNVRQVHIMEPWWNLNVIKQIIGRAIRICSHASLPKAERVVTVFNYLSVFEDKKRISPDIFVTKSALNKHKIESVFVKLLQESSLDCYLNYEHNNVNCRKIVTHFSNNLFDDELDFEDLPNLKEITYKNKKYYMLNNLLFEYLPIENLKKGYVPQKLGYVLLKANGSIGEIKFSK